VSLARKGAFLALAAFLISHGLALGLSPQDDAFISFRYARNALEGQGLVFNPGERVEGYTNFLWTVMMIPMLASGAEPAQGARALGLAAALALLVLLWRHERRSPGAGAGWSGLAAGFLLFWSSSFVCEAVQGLETVFFALLVTALILTTEREEEEGGPGLAPGVLGALAAITRPEGALVALGAAAHRLLLAPRGGGRGSLSGGRGRAALLTGGLPLAAAILHRGLAWAYYGQPFPNTVYAKVGGTWDGVVRGAGYALQFAGAWWPVLLLAVAGLGACAAHRRSLWGVFVLGYVAYIIAVGGDYKSTFRFFVPVMPIVSLLAAAGAIAIAGWAFERRVPRALTAASLLFGAALGIFAWSGDARDFAGVRTMRFETDRMAGRWLARSAPKDTVLATSNAGILPYYSGLTTIDMLGLTDAHISHAQMPGMGRGMAGHEKGDGDYVLGRRPGIVLFMRPRITDTPVTLEDAGRQMNFVAELQLWENPAFHREYEWVSVPLSGWTFNYFRRRSGEGASSAPL